MHSRVKLLNCVSISEKLPINERHLRQTKEILYYLLKINEGNQFRI